MIIHPELAAEDGPFSLAEGWMRAGRGLKVMGSLEDRLPKNGKRLKVWFPCAFLSDGRRVSLWNEQSLMVWRSMEEIYAWAADMKWIEVQGKETDIFNFVEISLGQ